MRLRKPYGLLWKLGARLHPQSVAKAWYAADCPSMFDVRPHVTWSEHLRWRLSCFLRAARAA